MTALRKLSTLAHWVFVVALSYNPQVSMAQFGRSAEDPRARAQQNSVFLSFSKFKIPFNVQSNAANIYSVQLWVSTDEGATWQMHGTAQPSEKDFAFQAAAEGRYLFSVQTIDSKGEVYPNPSPPLEVVVDTSKPEVAIQADTNEFGQLQVEVRMLDENLDPQSATLRVRTDRDPNWQAIDMSTLERNDDGVYRGQATVDIGSCREAAVVFSVGDFAQNAGEATFLLEMPRTASKEMKLASTGSQTAEFGGTSNSEQVPPGSRLLGSNNWQPVNETQSRNTRPTTSSRVDLQRPGRLITSGGGLELEPSSGSQESSTSREPSASRETSVERGVAEELPAPPQAAADPTSPVVEQGTPVADLPLQTQSQGANGVGGAYQCRSRAFALDYEIEALGGGALAEVELWGTEDGGRTWQQWGADPDRQSPFDVQVGNDGLFGFRMAIVGSNGLVSNRPKDGDNADMWINVDTTPPTAKITRAVYGEGDEDGMLVIDYTCQDSHLVDRPITLSYSESMDRDWKTIATGQKNSGLYIWKPSPNLPNKIYLQLEVADKAGNVGIHRMDLPIDTKGLGPLGRIQGFRPILNPIK